MDKTSPPVDPTVVYVAELHGHLRAVLAERFSAVPAPMLASALLYEATSLACHARTDVADAQAWVSHVAAAMHDQIASFGVGRRHP